MQVETTERQGIVEVTLRPSPGTENVQIDRAGSIALATSLRALSERSDARVVLLAASGASFCHGMDLAEAIASTKDEVAAGIGAFAECLHAIVTCPAPVVAVVAGGVSGGGVGFVAAADFCLCDKDVTFALPEPTWGLLPAVVLPILHRKIGSARSREWILRGDGISAVRARELGLVSDVAATAAELTRKVRDTARALLRGFPAAKRDLLALEHDMRSADLVAQLAVGQADTLARMTDSAHREMIRQMLEEGGLPPWYQALPKGLLATPANADTADSKGT